MAAQGRLLGNTCVLVIVSELSADVIVMYLKIWEAVASYPVSDGHDEFKWE
jgi:hypothetical protein